MPKNTYIIRQIFKPPQPKSGGKSKLVHVKMLLSHLSYSVLTTFCVLGLTGASDPATSSSDVELRVGIVQRFGDEPTEQLQLEPTKGDRLKLKFKTGDREQTLVTANPVKMQVVMQALPETVVGERVVLGTFRSFETAEESAERWRSQGIEVEIAQPERWQVWAKREVYNTPLLRRLLLQSVQGSGVKIAYLDTQILPQVPRVSWEVNGKRYSPHYLEVTTDKNLVRVNQTNNPDKARVYAGRMQLQPNSYGNYTLVNQVALETYLRGVVPHEIGAEAPYTSVEAQTILARTYALRNLRRFAVDGYQLCADVHCQVYRGLSGTVPRADRAIAATRGQVLTYQNQLVDALYSSTTGGVTAPFTDVWNGADRPYLQPVVDAANNVWNLSGQSLADENNFRRFISLEKGFNETGWNMFRWRKETSLEKITKDLQKFLKAQNSPYANITKVEQIGVVERSHSGRILKLAVKSDRGIFTLHKDEVRSAFAAPRSTLFYLQPLNKGKDTLWGYAFIGGGFGHGVGLSQTGSQELAKLGWSSSQILQFYYPGTQIQILSNAIKP